MSLEMKVAEKIKMGLTGDKEWRTLLLREANKLVTSAVLVTTTVVMMMVVFEKLTFSPPPSTTTSP